MFYRDYFTCSSALIYLYEIFETNTAQLTPEWG